MTSPAVLRDYQTELHASAVAALRGEGTRGQAIMACGTGKTITGLRIVEDIADDSVLLLFPNLALLAQTARSWNTHTLWRTPFGLPDWSAIAVCSEKDIKGEDHDRTTAAEVSQSTGIVSTTDPATVRAFLTQPGRKVVFSTYQSSPVITASVPDGFTFDVALADEAHRTSGATVSPSFGAVLDNALIPAKRRLFMTATQRVAADRGGSRLVRSMDDVILYGEVVAEYGFKEAIEAGTLSDYQLAVVYIDQSELDAVADATQGTDAHMLTTAIATVKASSKHDLHRLIAYHLTVDQSKEFADTLTRVAAVLAPERPLYAAHVDGNTKSAVRERVLGALRNTPEGTWSVVTNARVLTEGIDVPELDGVVFAAPRKSEVDVAQIVGRALRTGKRTEPSVILVPVLVEEGQDAEEAISGSSFDVPFQIMRSMRRVDSRITAEFTAAHMETREDEPQAWTRDEDGGSSMTVGPIRVSAGGDLAGDDAEPTEKTTPRIEVWLPESMSTDTEITYEERIKAFSRAVTTRMIDVVTDSWDKRAAETVEFWEREGRVPSQIAHDPEERGLGSWIVNQRMNAKRSVPSFTSDRRAYLDERMPGWLRDPEQDWRALADQTSDFIDENGRDPLNSASDPDEKRLASWLSRQRQSARNSTRSFTIFRRDYLDEHIPGWLRDTEQEWRDVADQTSAFMSENGKDPSAASSDPDERKLGAWLSNQRTNAKRHSPVFTSARRHYLDKHIPTWLRDPDQGWRDLVKQTAEFMDLHGRDPYRRARDLEEKRLGIWLDGQRRGARESRPSFTQYRRDYLNQYIPGWLRDPEQEWKDLAIRTSTFTSENGICPSQSASEPEEKKLAVWLSTQRKNAQRGAPSFTPSRRAYLDENIPGWMRDAGQKWSDLVDQVEVFISEHGRDPSQTATDPQERRLGTWLSNQRTNAKRSVPSFTSARRAYLDERIPGWLRDPEQDWRALADQTSAFTTEHGRDPSEGASGPGEKRLARWLSKQRQAAKKSLPHFTSDRRAYLDEHMPGWETSSRSR